MANVIGAVPFVIYTLMHAYLMKEQLDFMSRSRFNTLISVPIVVVAIGGMIDNARIAAGGLLGIQGASKLVMYTSYFLHLVFIPVTFTTLAELAALLLPSHESAIRWSGYILTGVLCLHGMYEYQHRVLGNLVIVTDMRMPRYTIHPAVKSQSLIFPVMLLGLLGVVMGVVVWAIKGQSLPMILQIVCFFGQAMVPVFKRIGFFTSNFLEIVFLYTMMHMQLLCTPGRTSWHLFHIK